MASVGQGDVQARSCPSHSGPGVVCITVPRAPFAILQDADQRIEARVTGQIVRQRPVERILEQRLEFDRTQGVAPVQHQRFARVHLCRGEPDALGEDRFVISRSVVRVRSPAPINSIVYANRNL